MTADAPSWHRQLLRQLRRAGLDPQSATTDPRLTALLAAVSSTYDDGDQYRYLNDRAFELSSRELLELNEQLRQAGETQLARQHAQLEAVFDAVAVGLVVVDGAGVVRDLNDTARTMFATTGPWLARPLAEVLRPAAQDPANDRTYASLLRAIPRGLPWRGDDVLIRGLDDAAFPASVTFSPLRAEGSTAGGVLAVTDVTERHTAAEELSYRASHDPLTGLLNRTALLDYLDQCVQSPPDSASPIGVLFIDLDRFKLVNDTLGHAAGDDLLKIIVDRIRAVMRQGDTLARLGGDEFVILCEDADAGIAMQVAERITRAVAQPVGLGHETAFVSASIGVTISGPGSTATSLLRDADVAVYRAKGDGRARAVLFDEAMRAEVTDRFRMERELRRVLDQQGLGVAFQPVFMLDTGALAGFETLVRWEHDGTSVSPAQFVALAEDTGLIGALGDHVLARAGEFLEQLMALGGDRVSVAVNVSPLQLGDPSLLERISDVLSRYRGDPDRLILEITETALLGDPDAARGHLEEVRELGARVVLDDFGTGYSSLSTLREFPLSGVKIDRAFVQELATNERDRAIVSAMTALGHALGMFIVAEGAESESDVTAVRELGCDSVQGFALSRPLTQDAALELARAHVARGTA